MAHKTCTIIVTYNRLQLLKGAVNALRNQSCGSTIVVVNNGSTDGTREYLDSQKDLTAIHQDNSGGSGGFFTGLKFAAEQGYEFAWIMDDDVVPDKDALRYLIDAYDYLSSKEEIGFLCSTVLDKHGNPANVPTVNMRRTENGFPSWNNYLKNGYAGVSDATFVSVLIPTKIIYSVGLPIKEFFIWGDDTEYTNRISLRYSCYLVGNSEVTHLRSGGAIDLLHLEDKSRIRMYRYSVRNNWYNNRQKYYDSKTKLINYLWHFSIIWRLLTHFQIYKIGIVLRGIAEGIFFHPTVVFPNECK